MQEEIVMYEPLDQVHQKSHVLKKALAEAIAAKWISFNQEPTQILTNSQVISHCKFKLCETNKRSANPKQSAKLVERRK